MPEPLEECEESMWLSGRAANAFFRGREFQQAYDELRRTLRLPGATANPLIWLRHGQCLYELGQTEEAKMKTAIKKIRKPLDA